MIWIIGLLAVALVVNDWRHQKTERALLDRVLVSHGSWGIESPKAPQSEPVPVAPVRRVRFVPPA